MCDSSLHSGAKCCMVPTIDTYKLSLSLSLSPQCWSSDTYHLWMLPTTISQQKAGWALFRKESSSSEREADNPSAADGRRGQGAKESSNESKEPDGCRGSRSSDVLVMRFMKNSIVDNPVIVSTCTFLISV